MSALNICLVAAGLRPATLVEPDLIHDVPVDYELIRYVISTTNLPSIIWSNGLLIYRPEVDHLVDTLVNNPDNHSLFGEILGYRCLAEFQKQGVPRYFINFVSRNPHSGNENPFIGFICVSLTKALIEDLEEQGRKFRDFFEQNDITDAVKLHIWSMWEGKQVNIINQWL